MSLFFACLIAAIAFSAGLLVAMSQQLRIALRRCTKTAGDERESCDVELAAPRFSVSQATGLLQPAAKSRVSAASPEVRAAAYRQVLDRLGDELEQDIAEWEAVLQEFPHVLFSGDVSEDPLGAPLAEDHIVSPQRSRRIDWEEHTMIVRLSKTGFAPEEIALWLNLPVERVHEVLSRP